MIFPQPTIDWYPQLKVFDTPDFSFNAELHEYRYKGEKFPSVTGIIEQFHEKFDSDYWSAIKAEERGVDQSVVLAEWKAKADRSCDLGTMVHEYAEFVTAGKKPPLVTDPDALRGIAKLDKIFATKLKNIIPVAQEIRIFSPKLKLAGTIDGLFEYKNKLIIGDYKTNEKFTTDEDRCFRNMLPPFENQLDNKLNIYSTQVSLYRVMLEEWGIKTEAAFLVHIPHGDAPAKFYPAKDFTKELKQYFKI